MSRAYSSMVLSEEKKPLPAVDMMDMRVHLALSLYVSSTRSCTQAHSTLNACVIAETCVKAHTPVHHRTSHSPIIHASFLHCFCGSVTAQSLRVPWLEWKYMCFLHQCKFGQPRFELQGACAQ